MRSTDSSPIVLTSVCFLPLKMYIGITKILEFEYKTDMFCKIPGHDLLRQLVAFSKFEWFFMSSDPKIKNSSAHSFCS